MRICYAIAVSAFLIVLSTTSMADVLIPAGRWVCEGSGVCVNIDGIHHEKQLTSAPAIVYDQSENKRGSVIKNCDNGKVTTYGVPNFPQNVAIDADFGWMCQEETR